MIVPMVRIVKSRASNTVVRPCPVPASRRGLGDKPFLLGLSIQIGLRRQGSSGAQVLLAYALDVLLGGRGFDVHAPRDRIDLEPGGVQHHGGALSLTEGNA